MPLELRRGERGVVRVGHRARPRSRRRTRSRAIEAAAESASTPSSSTCCAARTATLVLAHGPACRPARRRSTMPSRSSRRLGLAVQLDVKVARLRGRRSSRRCGGTAPRAGVRQLVLAADPARASPPRSRSCRARSRIRRTGSASPAPAAPPRRPRPALAVLRALAPARGSPRLLRAAGAQAATLNWAVVSPRRRRRLPRERGGGLRLDRERTCARKYPGRKRYRRYHHGRSADPRFPPVDTS